MDDAKRKKQEERKKKKTILSRLDPKDKRKVNERYNLLTDAIDPVLDKYEIAVDIKATDENEWKKVRLTTNSSGSGKKKPPSRSRRKPLPNKTPVELGLGPPYKGKKRKPKKNANLAARATQQLLRNEGDEGNDQLIQEIEQDISNNVDSSRTSALIREKNGLERERSEITNELNRPTSSTTTIPTQRETALITRKVEITTRIKNIDVELAEIRATPRTDRRGTSNEGGSSSGFNQGDQQRSRQVGEAINNATTTQPTQEDNFNDNDDDGGNNEEQIVTWPDYYFTPTFVRRIDVRNRLKTPVTLHTIMHWVNNWAQWRFCDGILRMRDNIKQRQSSDQHRFLSDCNKLTFLDAKENFIWFSSDPVRFARQIPRRQDFFDPKLMNKDAMDRLDFGNDDQDLSPLVLHVRNPDNNGDDIPEFVFNDITRPLVGQASAVTKDCVVIIRNNFGNQITDDSYKPPQYAFDNEKYKLSKRKLLELAFLMTMYKKKKARFVSIFDPKYIIESVVNLLRKTFRDNEKVYKPWFNYEVDRVKTLLQGPMTVLKQVIYTKVWELNLGDEYGSNRYGDLRAYQREHPNARWKVTNLGPGRNAPVRRQLYDQAIRETKQLYERFIKNWGTNDDRRGADVWTEFNQSTPTRRGEVDVQQEEEVGEDRPNQPAESLYQLERLDAVFNRRAVENLVESIENRVETIGMNLEMVAFEFDLPSETIANDIFNALFTKKLRGMKQGTIVRRNNDEYEVEWNIPSEIRNRNANLVVRETYTSEELMRNNRRVAALLLSDVGRTFGEGIWHSGGSDNGVKLVDRLRQGSDPFWTDDVLRDRLKEVMKKDVVTIELSTVDENNNDIMVCDGDEEEDDGPPQCTLFTRLEQYVTAFMDTVNLINPRWDERDAEPRPCNGRWTDPQWEKDENGVWQFIQGPIVNENPLPRRLTIAQEMEALLNTIEEEFTRDGDVEVGQCVTKYCSVFFRKQFPHTEGNQGMMMGLGD